MSLDLGIDLFLVEILKLPKATWCMSHDMASPAGQKDIHVIFEALTPGKWKHEFVFVLFLW